MLVIKNAQVMAEKEVRQSSFPSTEMNEYSVDHHASLSYQTAMVGLIECGIHPSPPHHKQPHLHNVFQC